MTKKNFKINNPALNFITTQQEPTKYTQEEKKVESISSQNRKATDDHKFSLEYISDIKVYTTEEAIKVLKVTKRTLYNYIKAGQIKAIKVGRDWRITEDALKNFLEVGTENNYLDKL